jgi:hypothetical protein
MFAISSRCAAATSTLFSKRHLSAAIVGHNGNVAHRRPISAATATAAAAAATTNLARAVESLKGVHFMSIDQLRYDCLLRHRGRFTGDPDTVHETTHICLGHTHTSHVTRSYTHTITFFAFFG